MTDTHLVTGAGLVLAGMGIASAVSPAASAWLDIVMRWVLGVGVGVPVAVWAVREVTAEVGLAAELRRARPAAAQQEDDRDR